jgi:glycosyltransferase involved in cell wall biosynthesis
VSVIIPAFNDARYIAQAIESVLAQSHAEIDLIVVDDGSTDDTGNIARGYGTAVRLLRQENSGVAAARNRGVAAARGDYVAFLDADDYWHPLKIEAQLRHLMSCGQCVAVYCNKVEIRAESAGTWPSPKWGDTDAEALCTDPEASGWLYRALLFDSIIHTTTIMVPRRMLDRIGTIDESLRKGEDLDYWLRLSRLGPIHKLEAVLSAYRIHDASLTHSTADVNYHALVVERAVRTHGLSDPAGNSLEQATLRRILGTSWSSFAYQHYAGGSLQVALDGARRALAYQPWSPKIWRLFARISLKSMSTMGVRAESR